MQTLRPVTARLHLPLPNNTERTTMKRMTIVAYLATIPTANWLINNVGTQYAPDAPHTIPVGFGYNAPSGVLMIGLALVLRDYVQQQFGQRTTLMAIAAGIVISYAINPAVATASAIAFAVSELADLYVFTQIKQRTLTGAVIASGIVGGIIDSFLFLQIAFGSTQFWQGQVIGKSIMAITAGLMIWGFNALPIRLHTKEA